MKTSTRTVEVAGRLVEILEAGKGPPLLYLHGIYDIHTLQAAPFPFHEALAESFTVIAPAHPGCGSSTGISDITNIEDLAFHYFDVLDALEIRRATVAGFCIGGWIATEMAVRNPERIGRMALIGAAGLQQDDALVGDVFMYSQHRDGGIMRELREMLFAEADGEIARSIVPDGRVAIPDEVRRYKSLTLAGRVGWEPPYLHDRKLAARLHRVTAPSLLVWGEKDRLIPTANARAYAEALPHASLRIVKGAGHSVHIEKPDECLAHIVPFLQTGKLPDPARSKAATKR